VDLKNVQTFVIIARELSFAKAAFNLHLSQPSVTARIQALESEIGKQLFIRKHRGIHLTKDGEAFLPFALQLLEIEKSAVDRLKSLDDSLQGKIAIGATATSSIYLLPEILSDVMQKYQQIEFKVVTGNTLHITEMLLQNQLDLGFVTSEVKKKQIKQVYLRQYDYTLVCSPNHPFAKKDVISMEEFIEMPMVTYEQKSDAWKKLKKLFAQHDSTPNIVMELNQIEAAKEIVKVSLCACMIPTIAVQREISEGRLVRLNVKEAESIKHNMSLIYMDKKKEYPLMNLMINMINDYFKPASQLIGLSN
jgi:DNA-binding transcriptional LysR family regulator